MQQMFQADVKYKKLLLKEKSCQYNQKYNR